MVATANAADIERALWSLQAYDTTALATVSDAGPRVGGAFFVPERTFEGIRMVIAQLRDSRALHDMALDPRVAFICSPGSPARWIQGTGTATLVADESAHADLYERLVAHAPGARAYVERLSVVPAVIAVRTLTVVDAVDRRPLRLAFDG
jgi:hypothetical protein